MWEDVTDGKRPLKMPRLQWVDNLAPSLPPELRSQILMTLSKVWWIATSGGRDYEVRQETPGIGNHQEGESKNNFLRIFLNVPSQEEKNVLGRNPVSLAKINRRTKIVYRSPFNSDEQLVMAKYLIQQKQYIEMP